jgi:zinc transporter 1
MATNLGVILAAAIMWKTSSPARFYADPAIGMAIALLIFVSAVPLVRRSGEILLQTAPEGVKLEDIKHDIEKVLYNLISEPNCLWNKIAIRQVTIGG